MGLPVSRTDVGSSIWRFKRDKTHGGKWNLKPGMCSCLLTEAEESLADSSGSGFRGSFGFREAGEE